MTAAHAPSSRREAGYAMLLVFLMAAIIAIGLYRELPRFAFEQQRAKEEALIERGEQYKRAIQVFVRKMNRYPATIEELESTNNIRFLRKRYIDPMTGKDKWRLIHVNGGVLTDSIIQKTPTGNQPPAANTNTFIAEGPVLGATNDQSQQINPAMRRRSSENRPAAPLDAPDQPPPVDDPDNPNPNPTDADQSQTPGTPPLPTPVNGVMPGQTMAGTPMNRFPLPNQGVFPGQAGAGQMGNGGVYSPSQSGVYSPGAGAYPGGPPGATPQSPGFAGQGFGQGTGQGGFGQSTGQGGFGQSTGQGGFGQQGMGPGMGQTASGFGQPAAQPGFGDSSANGQGANPNNLGGMLGLNGPRPGGTTGLPGMGGTQIGGGIAGVASEAKDASIKVYGVQGNERKKYNEWEFVYDKSKDRGLAGVMSNGGVPGTPAGQMGSMPPGVGNTSTPGGNSGFGGGSSFGQSSSGFGQSSSGFGQSSSGFGQSSSGFGQSSSGFGQSTTPQPQPPPQPPPQN